MATATKTVNASAARQVDADARAERLESDVAEERSIVDV
jgi:hypothetical protein